MNQPQMSPAMAWAFFGAMVFGNFMAILDIQIVASSLNEIQAGLGATQSEVTWVQTAYLIAEVIAIPLSGFLSRLFSTRVYFACCALGFSVASLLCGLAWNIESMLVFRAIQGFLGGGMIPTTMAALFVFFPQRQQAGHGVDARPRHWPDAGRLVNQSFFVALDVFYQPCTGFDGCRTCLCGSRY